MMVAAIYNYKRASVIRCALRDGRGVYRAGRVWRVVIEMGPGVFVLANKQRAGRAGYWHARYLAKKAAHKRYWPLLPVFSEKGPAVLRRGQSPWLTIR